MHDNWGLKRGLMTTVHAATRDPEDRRRSVEEGLARRPRHPGEHHPVVDGAAKAVGKVLPALNGKLTGMSFRIPASDVSVVDLTCELDKDASYEDIARR